jgi:hypothetical protein
MIGHGGIAMEMIHANQMVSFPLWQLLALLGAVTFCTMVRKSIGSILLVFLFALHWVFWQKQEVLTSDGQEYTMIAFFFGIGLICSFSIAWHLYKTDHVD